MKPIPLYDATAPITCTINPDEIAGRIEAIERMRTNLQRLDRTDHGLVLHFANRPDLAADVHRFAIDEKRCCQFWGFAIESTDYELTLRWDAPPDARELLATIAAYLEGDEPVTAISGLL
jgi:hypothetical protein